MTRRWLVTGCSSGLGLALARAVLAAGDQLLATTRRPSPLDALAAEHPEQLVTATLDLGDAVAAEAAVRLAADRFGGVDVLVNNAGTGLFGAVEEVSDAELRAQLETLVVAPWRLARLVLPLMRAQGSGHILNVSSLAGRMAWPGLSAYVTGKYALEGMSQALAAEAGPLGIRVTVLEPGGFATGYGDALAEAAARVPAYAPSTTPMRDALRGMRENESLGRPEDFADLVLRVVAAPSAPLRLPVGDDAHTYVAAVEELGRQELAAARAFALGDPTTAPVPAPTRAS
ncbi:SDR family NAD(P)-dependent oxidoreductase [Kitasatospora mediocidica]|uniref:SDR family NAD(P)-dependent oxidoreductase n=1 Tax=Kitasatospora mediocidica TaxID=58352 RepID=UPI0005683BF7|nr:SDR family NAD(P)-dependent oxidoreductase [Kitasatospora mediocidica]